MGEIGGEVMGGKVGDLLGGVGRRREMAEGYCAGLAGVTVTLPVKPSESTHVYHVYAVLAEKRDALQQHLAERGVPTIIYYPCPLHLQRVYESLGHRRGDFPVAEGVSQRILPLPMYPELTNVQVD